MTHTSRGMRVQVFFGESDQVGHTPRSQAILEYLRREGAAGATVMRGIAGFGANSRIHTAAILRLSVDLPLVLTWIDAPERVDRLLPGLKDLAGSGIVTLEEVGIAAYGGRRIEQLRFDLDVSDVMTAPVQSVSADASVRASIGAMIGRDFRALPVVDGSGVLVGIVTNGDLIGRGGLPVRLELLAAMEAAERSELLDGLPERRVGEVMTAPAISVRAGSTLAAATRRMSDHRLKRLPVVDGDGRLLGMISRADVLRAVAETFPQEMGTAPAPVSSMSVAALMRDDAPTVRADAPLALVLEAVVSTRLNRAVVLDEDDRVVGVISDADVLRAVEPAARAGVADALMRVAGRHPQADVRARDLASGPPITVSATASIAEAARLMVEHRRKILPVVGATGHLLGILDRADLLHASRQVLEVLGLAAQVNDE